MLKQKIQSDLKKSLKAGDSLKRVVLGSLVAAITNKEKEKRLKLSKEIKDSAELEQKSLLADKEIIEVIGSEIKKRKEAKEQYEKGNRPELAKKEDDEAKILVEYMPPQIGEAELLNIIREVIAQTGAKDIKDMGRVMNEVMSRVKGQANGSQVSALVKKELSI